MLKSTSRILLLSALMLAVSAVCYAGAAVTIPPPGCTDDQSCSSDIDDDGDVDLADFATFALNFTG